MVYLSDWRTPTICCRDLGPSVPSDPLISNSVLSLPRTKAAQTPTPPTLLPSHFLETHLNLPCTHTHTHAGKPEAGRAAAKMYAKTKTRGGHRLDLTKQKENALSWLSSLVFIQKVLPERFKVALFWFSLPSSHSKQTSHTELTTSN